MNWSTFMTALIGSTIPATLGTLIMLLVKRGVDRSLEQFKSSLQLDVVKITKWHEKRLAALETIYHAFCSYLDFLRQALYVPRGPMSMDPMHEFRRALDQQLLYLDDGLATKITQYQGELLLFWNSAMDRLARDGEQARSDIQRELDFEIPTYLQKLQKDINEFTDPHYRAAPDSIRELLIARSGQSGPVARWSSRARDGALPDPADK